MKYSNGFLSFECFDHSIGWTLKGYLPIDSYYRSWYEERLDILAWWKSFRHNWKRSIVYYHSYEVLFVNRMRRSRIFILCCLQCCRWFACTAPNVWYPCSERKQAWLLVRGIVLFKCEVLCHALASLVASLLVVFDGFLIDQRVFPLAVFPSNRVLQFFGGNLFCLVFFLLLLFVRLSDCLILLHYTQHWLFMLSWCLWLQEQLWLLDNSLGIDVLERAFFLRLGVFTSILARLVLIQQQLLLRHDRFYLLGGRFNLFWFFLVWLRCYLYW